MTLTGLNLLVYATYVFLAAIALALLGCGVMALIGVSGVSAMNSSTSPNAANAASVSMASIGIVGMVVYALIGLCYLANLVLQITGHGFCMAVPNKVGNLRKGLAIATFGCACGIVLLYLMSCGLTFVSPRLGGVAGFLPPALGIGYFVCYFLFLRTIAVSLKERALAGQIVYFMIAVPVVMVLVIVMYVVMLVAMGAAFLGAASSNTAQGAGEFLWSVGHSRHGLRPGVLLRVRWYDRLVYHAHPPGAQRRQELFGLTRKRSSPRVSGTFSNR